MAKVPASIRYKNPGAMWGSALAIKWGAEKKPVKLADGTGQNNNIAVFPTFELGICAQLDLWRSSHNYKNKTLAEALRVWSGGNSVESYISFVCQRVPTMSRHTILSDGFWASDNGIKFLKAQAWHEAGQPYPAPESDWVNARARVMNGVLPVPVTAPKAKVATGTTATATVVAAAATQDWTLAIPVILVGLSVAAVIWFIWPKSHK